MLLSLLLLLLLLFTASLLLGAQTPGNALPSIAVLLELRLPRSLAALLVGASLGVAGLIMQSLTRNRLAEPGLLGVNAGAALGIISAIALWQIDTGLPYVLAALLGAIVGNLGVLGIASISQRNAQNSLLKSAPLRLILAGVALGASFQGLSSAILLSQPSGFDQYRFWVLGSLSGINLDMLGYSLPALLSGLGGALLMARPLSALSLGDDHARSLGHAPGRFRFALLLCASLLTAAAVALAGPIAFLGLLAPFFARTLSLYLQAASARAASAASSSPAHSALQASQTPHAPGMGSGLLLSAAIGALLLLFADILARLLAAPYETPLGVVTACLGAPLMIYLARKEQP